MNHNRIRAAIMGGLDGVITLILGIAFNQPVLALLGMLLAGALSMAIAEYASVSAQRDVAQDGEQFNPWEAAISSLFSFLLGGAVILLPLIPSGHHWDSFSFVLAGLLVFAGSAFGVGEQVPDESLVWKAGARTTLAAAVAVGISYGVGVLLG